MKESDLYQPIKKLLEGMGYAVYAEVEPSLRGNYNARADVIGYLAPAVCIVEMKTSLTIDLIEQAYKWIPYSNYIYVAVPERKKGIPKFVAKMLSDFGIGILEVNPYGSAYISQRAKFRRPRYRSDWAKILLPQHQTWAEGGSMSGGHVTPYKLTIERVRNLMSKNPHRWWTIKEILDHCETHYSSPKSSLSKALREFENTWCESKVEGRKLHYRIKGK